MRQERAVFDYFDEFFSLSVLLTGFSKTELEATGMASTYFKTLVDRTEPSILLPFFENVVAVMKIREGAAQDDAISSQLLPDAAYNGVAGRIILMWYEGLWTTRVFPPQVISTQAYVQGLMWPAAKTHPSGARQAGFGSWQHEP